ncbi:TPA: hypothetical protein NV714_003524 [Escherichia coli]|nr:hypothetical protein [Escherichia coli]
MSEQEIKTVICSRCGTTKAKKVQASIGRSENEVIPGNFPVFICMTCGGIVNVPATAKKE